VALYKSPEWNFQKESRFIIDFSVSPLNKDMSANKGFDLLQSFNDSNLPFEYKDIKLSDYFFRTWKLHLDQRAQMYIKNLFRCI